MVRFACVCTKKLLSVFVSSSVSPVDRPRCCDCSETLTRYVERDKKLLCLACAKRAQDAEDRKREIASPRSGSKSKEPSLVERAKRSLADEARKNEEPPVPPRSAASSRTAVKCVSCIINAEIKPSTPYYRVGDKIYCERHKPKPAPESSPSGMCKGVARCALTLHQVPPCWPKPRTCSRLPRVAVAAVVVVVAKNHPGARAVDATLMART